MRQSHLSACLVVAASLFASPVAGQAATADTSIRTYQFIARHGRERPLEGALTFHRDSVLVTLKAGTCRREIARSQTRQTVLFACDQAFDIDDLFIEVDRIQPANSRWRGTIQTSREVPTDTCVRPILDSAGKPVGCAQYGTRTEYRASAVSGFLEIAAAK